MAANLRTDAPAQGTPPTEAPSGDQASQVSSEPGTTNESMARILSKMGEQDGGQRRLDLLADPQAPAAPQLAPAGGESPAASPSTTEGNTGEVAEDSALRAQVQATVAKADPEVVPETPNPRVVELEAQLAAANAKLAAAPVLPPDPKAKEQTDPEKPDWQKSITHRLAGMAKQELGDSAPQYLLDEYTVCLTKLAQAEGFVDSTDVAVASAAKTQVDTALHQARALRLEASNHSMQAELAALKEQGTQTQQVSPELRQQRVEAMLSDPKLPDHLENFPHLAGAIKAGAFDPAMLSDGIAWDASWEDINAQAERNMAYANNAFSRTRFGVAQAATPTTPPPAGNETTPPGARVGNPAAFAPRRDEPAAAPQRRGPGTVGESTARVLAQLNATQNRRQEARPAHPAPPEAMPQLPWKNPQQAQPQQP